MKTRNELIEMKLKELENQIKGAEDGMDALDYLEQVWEELQEKEELSEAWTVIGKITFPFRTKIALGMLSLVADVADGWGDRAWPDVKTASEALDYHKTRLNWYMTLLLEWVIQAEDLTEMKAIRDLKNEIRDSYVYEMNLIKANEEYPESGLACLAVRDLKKVLEENPVARELLKAIRDLRKLGVDRLMEIQVGIRSLYDTWEDLASTLADFAEYWEHGDWGDEETAALIDFIQTKL